MDDVYTLSTVYDMVLTGLAVKIFHLREFNFLINYILENNLIWLWVLIESLVIILILLYNKYVDLTKVLIFVRWGIVANNLIVISFAVGGYIVY